MIRSAPSRLAAITAHRPTAPSPIDGHRVAAADAGGDGAVVAGAITSDSVSSDGSSAESAATGSLTSVPSASGTRTASP